MREPTVYLIVHHTGARFVIAPDFVHAVMSWRAMGLRDFGDEDVEWPVEEPHDITGLGPYDAVSGGLRDAMDRWKEEVQR